MGCDQGFPNCGKGWGKFPSVRRKSETFGVGGGFFTEEDLRRSDFEDSNPFQS